MTTPSWPATLPSRPLAAGLSGARQDNKITFQPEVGDAKVRRRFTGVVKDFSATFILTSDQRDDLDTFHDTTLSDGVGPFTWSDPINGDSGTFRFTSPPQWSQQTPGAWQAVCQLRRID